MFCDLSTKKGVNNIYERLLYLHNISVIINQSSFNKVRLKIAQLFY